MPRGRAFDTSHIDYLETLMRDPGLSRAELSVRMSRQFKQRVTPAQVSAMIQRMRTPSDPFYRNLPYQRPGARFTG